MYRFSWLVAGCLGISVVSAQAGLVRPVGENNPCDFKVTFQWEVTPPEVATVPPPGPPNWLAVIRTAEGSVTAGILHDNQICPGTNGAAAEAIALSVDNPVPVDGFRSRTAAAQVGHGKAVDIGILRTNVTRTNGAIASASVAVAGLHRGVDQVAVKPSFHNDLATPEDISIQPDYRLNDPRHTIVKLSPTNPPEKGGELKAKVQGHGDLDSSRLPNTIHTGRPGDLDDETGTTFFGTLASYDMLVSGSPMTDTTLAFLGLVDGEFSELDLAAAIELFIGFNEFFVPSLRPVADPSLPLYVGVDLTQWLGAEAVFSPLDIFNLTNGMSDALPGILVSTSPITLGLNGYETANPFSGQVFAAGRIDGRDVAVPEPATLVLVLIGLALGTPWGLGRVESLTHRGHSLIGVKSCLLRPA